MGPSLNEIKLAEKISERVLVLQKERVWELNPKVAKNQLKETILTEIMVFNRGKVIDENVEDS